MHLAICDDHIADRKQMERLLGRESDRRLNTTGVLYIDSYGSKNSILSTPMIYDALFMDMTEDCDAVELANMLRADGTAIPIVFCCDKVNYREAPNLPENVLFMDKPILVQELSEIIDQLLVYKNSQEKTMEFRTRMETYYLKEEDIMYVCPESNHIILHLTNGESRIAEMRMENFCGNAGAYDCYVELASRVVLNMDYITGISFFKATMKDGKAFKLSAGESKTLKRILNSYQGKKGK